MRSLTISSCLYRVLERFFILCEGYFRRVSQETSTMSNCCSGILLTCFVCLWKDVNVAVAQGDYEIPIHKMIERKRSSQTFNFRHRFLQYSEIMVFLEYVKKRARNVDVHIGSIGRSFEGRLTPYIKISKRNTTNDVHTDRKTIFVDGGLHSREWIGPAMAIEIIHRLVFNVEHDPEVDLLLDRFTWLLVPIANPDGYSYSFLADPGARLWRKSRSTAYSGNPGCFGVDLNRNFGWEWNDNPESGGNSDPCSGTYSGPRPFSEPETQNLRDLLLTSTPLHAYLTLHSYGQFFLYPWGYSARDTVPDDGELMRVGRAFAKTMEQRGYEYTVGGSAKTLYPAAGSSDDYARGAAGVKYAYTLELPPRHDDRYGFMLPEEKVGKIVTDTWMGIKTFAFQTIDKELQRERLNREKDAFDRIFTFHKNNVSSTEI